MKKKAAAVVMMIIVFMMLFLRYERKNSLRVMKTLDPFYSTLELGLMQFWRKRHLQSLTFVPDDMDGH